MKTNPVESIIPIQKELPKKEFNYKNKKSSGSSKSFQDYLMEYLNTEEPEEDNVIKEPAINLKPRFYVNDDLTATSGGYSF